MDLQAVIAMVAMMNGGISRFKRKLKTQGLVEIPRMWMNPTVVEIHHIPHHSNFCRIVTNITHLYVEVLLTIRWKAVQVEVGAAKPEVIL